MSSQPTIGLVETLVCGRVAEVLNRKRPLTLRMIRNLERNLGISAEILVQEYPLADDLEGGTAAK
jgi:plasmid maintenance system antidote protein VapI